MSNYKKLPNLESYYARDNQELFFRYYQTDSNVIMILLHGITEDSKYLYPLAKFISENNLAQVYTPDLRGYGTYPVRRGDLDYIGQHEDDINDLINYIKLKQTPEKIIVAGHSAGGGTTLRFAHSTYANEIDAFLLIAPFVHYSAPIMNKNKQTINTKIYKNRFINLSLLNLIGIKKFNYKTILSVLRDESLLHGTETLNLSYNLLKSRVPQNYKAALTSLKENTLVLIGDEDEEFDYRAYEPLFTKYSKATTKIIQATDHDGILSNNDSFSEIEKWIKSLN